MNVSFDGPHLPVPRERPCDVDHVRRLVDMAIDADRVVRINLTLTERSAPHFAENVRALAAWGVSDIKPVTAVSPGVDLARVGAILSPLVAALQDVPLPIFRFRLPRLAGDGFRGLPPEAPRRCHLLRDDLCADSEGFYPCMIHMRERGRRICAAGDLRDLDRARREFFADFSPPSDPICRTQCPDFMSRFNVAVEDERRRIHGAP